MDVNDPLDAGEFSFALLYLAVSSGNLETVKLLIDYGADVRTIWDGRTPLEAAILMTNCNADIIDLLLARGAWTVFKRYTILHRAAFTNARLNGLHVLFHLLQHENLKDGKTWDERIEHAAKSTM